MVAAQQSGNITPIDAFLGTPPEPQVLRARKIGIYDDGRPLINIADPVRGY